MKVEIVFQSIAEPSCEQRKRLMGEGERKKVNTINHWACCNDTLHIG